MLKISCNNNFKDCRYYNVALSNKAEYDYIMMLKYWCLKEASSLVSENTDLAWIDFGFNHGDSFYTNSEDFNFLWEYDFPKKINIFSFYDPSKMTCIDSLLLQKDCIQGSPVVVPKNLAGTLWSYIKHSMWSLISLDCIDDDQQLLLMAYKLHKDDFNYIISDWFEPFALCSNQNFSIKGREKPISVNANVGKQRRISFVKRMNNKIKSKMKKGFRKIKLLFPKGKKRISKDVLKKCKEYSSRMYEKAKRYYGD